MKRNYDRISNEKARKCVDPIINAMADELSECYYKHWKLGNSKPFQGYDVQATLEDSKALFDKIHGAIYRLQAVMVHKRNQQLSKEDQYPVEKYNDILDKDYKKIGDKDKEQLAELRKDAPLLKALRAAFREKVDDKNVRDGNNKDYALSECANLKGLVGRAK